MARYQASMIGSFPEYSGTSIGGPAYPVFSTVVNDAPGQTNPNSPAQLGDILVDKFGNNYAYVRAVAGLTVGQCLKYAANLPGTVSASTTANVINTNITTTINEALVGSFLTSTGTAGGGGTNFGKLIKAQTAIGTNTQFTVSKVDIFFGVGKQDGDTLPTIPTTGDPAIVVRPWAVDVAGLNDTPVGIALGTVTSGNRTLVQVGGLALVSCIGSVDALTDNGTVITGATGNGKGTLTAATAASAAAETKSIVGIAKAAYASATAKLVPVLLWDLVGRY